MSERVDIEALRALLEKCKSLPWTQSVLDGPCAIAPVYPLKSALSGLPVDHVGGRFSFDHDAALVVAAVNALPSLLTEVAQLRAENAALREKAAAFDRIKDERAQLVLSLDGCRGDYVGTYADFAGRICALVDTAPKEPA